MPVRVSVLRLPSLVSTSKVSPTARPRLSAVFSVRMALLSSKGMALCPCRVRKVKYAVIWLSSSAVTMLTVCLSPLAL